MKNSAYQSIMLIDNSEIDNLIHKKMIEAAGISEHIYSYSSAEKAIEFIQSKEKIQKKQS